CRGRTVHQVDDDGRRVGGVIERRRAAAIDADRGVAEDVSKSRTVAEDEAVGGGVASEIAYSAEGDVPVDVPGIAPGDVPGIRPVVLHAQERIVIGAFDCHGGSDEAIHGVAGGAALNL